MADTTVTDRRIRPIQAALAAGNWKQAWKECEKWQKKGEASDRFLTLKAAVLIHSPDPKQQEKGRNETLQLCRKDPAVVNLEAIYQLQDSLHQLSLDAEEGPKIWERAIAARPTDKDLLTTWLNTSISQSNWHSAQKATTNLRKAFPKERQYEYWNILMCYLIHENQSLPEKDRKLFGTLANRMISKTAQPGPAEKAISDPEELSLLAAIMIKTGSAGDLVQLLQSESLKAVVDLDQSHADTLLLRALRVLEDPDSISSYCHKVLFANVGDSEPPHDDRVWLLLSKSSNSAETREVALNVIDKVLARYPEHRQALLAKVDLLTGGKEEDSNTLQAILDTCHTYYKLFGMKAFCFEDLIHRLSPLEARSVRSFRNILNDDSTTSRTPLQDLFALKLEYQLLFEDETTELEAMEFAGRALTLYVSDAEKQTVGPEAALLAALALLREAARSADTALVLQASMILQSSCSMYKDYYPLRILLIQVQIISGQMHLAMQHFFHLSVKNLQWETVGHLLLTRISSLNPHQYGKGEESLNPLAALDTALTVFDNSHKSLDQAIQDGLRRGNYSNVIDTIELRTNLERSMVQQLYTLEERKCLRARNLGVKPELELYQGELTDLRDTSFMPNYGVQDDRVTDLLRVGPRPSQGWIHANSMHEHLLSYLMAELAGERERCAITYENLISVLRNISAATPDMTEAEQTVSVVHRALCAIVVQINSKQNSDAKALVDVVAWLGGPSQEAEPAVVNQVEYPDWKYLHTQFVRLETLQTIGYFAAILLKKFRAEKDKAKVTATKDLRDALQDLRKLVDEQSKAVHEQAKELKQKLNASGVLGKLVDAVLGKTDEVSESEEQGKFAQRLLSLQSEAAVEEYCGSLKESWEDALDGILATRIKTI